MKAAEGIIAARRARAERYDLMLKSEDWLKPPECPGGNSHGYQSYVCLLKPKGRPLEPGDLSMERVSVLNEKRNELMDRLADRGIATRQGTHAVHTLGYYRRKYHLRPGDYMKSFAAERLSVTLPLYVQMTDEEQDFVIRELKECVALLGY
jgi:dTDP-4-amino-4,6-dideoxygalactose transaminase